MNQELIKVRLDAILRIQPTFKVETDLRVDKLKREFEAIPLMIDRALINLDIRLDNLSSDIIRDTQRVLEKNLEETAQEIDFEINRILLQIV